MVLSMNTYRERPHGRIAVPRQFEMRGKYALDGEKEINPANISEVTSILQKAFGWSTRVLTEQFESNGKEYVSPTLIITTDPIESASGGNPSIDGPFYDPADNTVYVNPTFFQKDLKKLDHHIWAVTVAYCVLHEVGHHVQFLQESQDYVKNEDPNPHHRNLQIIARELQADCYAGMLINTRNLETNGKTLDDGDTKEVQIDAGDIGDDRIMHHGHIPFIPWLSTHGKAKMRQEAVSLGLGLTNVSQVPELDYFYDIAHEVYEIWKRKRDTVSKK